METRMEKTISPVGLPFGDDEDNTFLAKVETTRKSNRALADVALDDGAFPDPFGE